MSRIQTSVFNFSDCYRTSCYYRACNEVGKNHYGKCQCEITTYIITHWQPLCRSAYQSVSSLTSGFFRGRAEEWDKFSGGKCPYVWGTGVCLDRHAGYYVEQLWFMSAWLTDGFDWLYTNSSARWAKNGYLTTIHLLYCNSRKWKIILIRQPGLLQEQARWDQFSKNGHDDTDFKQCWNNITKYKYQVVITKHKTCQVVVKWTATRMDQFYLCWTLYMLLVASDNCWSRNSLNFTYGTLQPQNRAVHNATSLLRHKHDVINCISINYIHKNSMYSSLYCQPAW